MKVLAIPALAILTLLAWRVRRGARQVERIMAPWEPLPHASMSSDRHIVAWRRAGVL